MSVVHYVLLGVAVCGGVACVVVGLVLANPPERGGAETAMYHALGDAYGALIGWALIGFGGLMLGGGMLGSFVLLRRAIRTRRDARTAPPGPSLPEARAPDQRAACVAMTSATHMVRRLAVGRSRNSFGPCAFEPGPRTPVMKNCASG